MATPKPLENPLGGIPAPGASAQPIADVHPDLAGGGNNTPAPIVPAQEPVNNEQDLQANAPNEQSNTEAAVPVAEVVVPAAAEKKLDEEIDFNSFLELDGTGVTKPVENKKVETVAPVVPAVAVNTNPEARDYTPFEAVFGKENIGDLKKMSNDAFNKLKPVIAKHLETENKLKEREEEVKGLREGRIPDSYYENERAFLLTPDFQESLQAVQQAEGIATHWQNQLAKVRAGEESYQGLRYNDKGEIVTTDPIKIDAAAEAVIQKAMITTMQQASTVKSQMQNLQQNFVAKHRESLAQLQNLESKAFGAFDKPEMQPVINDTVKALLPKSFHSNPLAKFVAKLVIVNKALVQKVTQGAQPPNTAATGTTGKPVVATSDRRAAGPQPNVGVQAAGLVKQKGGEEVTFEDFEKLTN